MLKIISIYPLIKQVAEDAEAELLYRMENGEAIQGLQIVERRGNRKLNGDDEQDTVKILKENFPNLNPVETKVKLRTITSLEKELGKGALDLFCTRPIKKELKILDSKTVELLKQMEISSIITASKEDL
jgi:hypothetical protein